MKTNIVLESQSRNLFGQIVRQQTKEGMLNLSDLQEAYTIARVKNGWVEKNITMIMTNPANLETTFYLLEKQGAINISRLSFMENVANHGFAKYMKTLGVYKTTGARNTKTVWVNPYIWVMVAMELNPIFKAEVIGWLTDSLIINRIEAGNFYKELSRAMSKFKDVNYVQVAKALNYCIFGKHETGLRNSATKEELKQLEQLESRLAFAIDMNYIKTFDELIIELQKVYKLIN
jgi:hypothetical protein